LFDDLTRTALSSAVTVSDGQRVGPPWGAQELSLLTVPESGLSV
jgi:hypothetical protein